MFDRVLFLVLLLMLNGFFSMAEIAFITIHKNKLKPPREEGRSATLLKKALDNLDDFAASIELCTFLVQIFTVLYAAQAFSGDIINLALRLGVFAGFTQSNTALVVTVVLSYFMLVFGQLAPRGVGLKYAVGVAFWSIWPLWVLFIVTSPFVKILKLSAEMAVRLFGVRPEPEDTQEPFEDPSEVLEDEIRQIVEDSAEGEPMDPRELAMIHNVITFDENTAEDICVHRTDIIALDVNSPPEEVRALLLGQKYSRIPVYEENMDNILGVLHIKDILQRLLKGANFNDLQLRELIVEPFVVPLSKKTNELFKEMQKNKVVIAIVVDEYGGTQGLVTMEDLIEEVMGSILDEFDDEEAPSIGKLDDNTYVLNGTADLDEIGAFFNIRMPVDEYDTLSGFIIGQLGHIPEEGERPTVEFEGWMFKVSATEEKRISEVIASRIGLEK